MSGNSSKQQPSSKPDKKQWPQGSPLWLGADCRWCKKINGTIYYFGRGAHDDALQEYETRARELHTGRKAKDDQGATTLYQLTAKFLIAKMAKRDNGEL